MIALSRVTYDSLGEISSGFADFLDTMAQDGSPTRLYLSIDDETRIGKLMDFSRKNPDDEKVVLSLLGLLNKEKEVDIAWG